MTITPSPAAIEWRVEVPGWLPASLNQLVGNRYKAMRLKQKDSRAILDACRIHGVPPVGLTKEEKKERRALGIVGRVPGDPVPRKRHVRLEVKLAKGARAFDEDNFWKSLLDGCKHAGMIFDDNRQWCSHDSEITFTRGVDRWDRGTVIILSEDG